MSDTPAPVTGSKLAAKLARILGELGKVEKTGRNDFHHYDYLKEDDLVWAIRPKLADAGIFVFESTVSQHLEVLETGVDERGNVRKALITTVATQHTFMDGETGEQFTVMSQGQGADNGDKGAYKAITGAQKYFLYKNFMIATGDDPEADPKTDERGAGGVTGKTSTSSSTARSSGSSAASGGGSTSSTSVPRDAEVDKIKALEPKFTDQKWTGVVVHFGKDKGVALGKMESAKLTWWIENYKPEPFRGKFADADLALRAALNVADVEWK